ncbi:MAG: stage II sporulation protein M [Galbitalea sp.]
MDLDAYAAAHREEWDRLAQLARARRLTGAESDELIDRYQSGASDLSAIATTVGQSAQGDRLSVSLSRARLRFTGARGAAFGGLPAFFGAQLPAALYRIRWITLANALFFVIVATAYAVWLSANPQVLASLGTPAELHRYASSQFVGYYSAHPGADFATQVWTNNALIAAETIALGITGLFPIVQLLTNAQNVGVSAAVLHQYGDIGHLWYIAPHGQLELYSIFTAAAAGMMLAWAWIAPGARTRTQALAEDGRAFFAVVIGLILSLAVSGSIEGFVTRQPWPWWIKIGMGSVALAAFLFYQWWVGGRAWRAGETGDLAEFEAGAKRLTAG